MPDDVFQFFLKIDNSFLNEVLLACCSYWWNMWLREGFEQWLSSVWCNSFASRATINVALNFVLHWSPLIFGCTEKTRSQFEKKNILLKCFFLKRCSFLETRCDFFRMMDVGSVTSWHLGKMTFCQHKCHLTEHHFTDRSTCCPRNH